MIGVALLATACGGGDEEDGGDAEATATEATTEATATESTATATESSGEGEALTGADLASVFAGFQDATFNVTYQLESDDAEQALTGEWRWIQDNAGDRARFEAEADGDQIIMIITSDQTVLCADGACFDAAGVMGAAMPNLGDMFTQSLAEVQADTTNAEVRRVDGRTVAGTDTECLEFEDTTEGVTGVACYADGVPLYIESETAEGNFRMEATSFSTDVSDADFEAPFPVTSLGG
ncbi:MAG: hypothetical protein AB7F65_09025 [Dehalococcoidia bacterium]